MFKKYFVPVLKFTGIMILYILLAKIFGRLATVFLLQAFNIENPELTLFAGQFASMVTIILIYLKSSKRQLKDIGIQLAPGWYKKLFNGAACGLIAGTGGILFLILTGMCVVEGFYVDGIFPALGTLFFGFIKCFILIALTQELFFRGYLFNLLKSRFTTAGAMIMASLFFSSMYFFNSNSNQIYIFNIFITGVLMCLLVIKNSSIWPAVGFNFGLNFVIGTLFSNSGVRGSSSLIDISLRKYDLITGAGYGIKGGLFFTALVLIIVIYILSKGNLTREFYVGLKRGKNIALIVLISMFTVMYVLIDIASWIPKEFITDNSSANIINEYENVNNYDMKLNFSTKDKTIDGIQTVSYINTTDKPLNEIYFHIYANAFAEYDGGIDIRNVKVNGRDVQYKIEGSDRTLLDIPLDKHLKPDNRASICIEYSLKIPRRSNNGFADRLAYGDDTYNLGNFFPIVSVYESTGWDKHLYDKKGDAFYSETSNFSVEITAPKSQVIASTGAVEDKISDGRNNIWKIKANAVRDFAFVSSSTFTVVGGTVDGTLIKSYASSGLKAQKALDIGQHALKIYNQLYGKYPYPALNIVQTDISGGMEYPNMVMIGTGLYRNINYLSYADLAFYIRLNGQFEDTIAHEIGHQWWYGMVGNDEYREAWIDEPLTQYASLTYFKNRYGSILSRQIFDTTVLYFGGPLMGYNASLKHLMRRPLNEFNESEYYSLIYRKGTMMVHDLCNIMGEEKFYQFQRTLYDRYRFKVLKGEDVIKTASEISGKDMSGFFNKWLDTNYIGDYIQEFFGI